MLASIAYKKRNIFSGGTTKSKFEKCGSGTKIQIFSASLRPTRSLPALTMKQKQAELAFEQQVAISGHAHTEEYMMLLIREGRDIALAGRVPA